MEYTRNPYIYNDDGDTGLGYFNSEQPYYYRQTMVSPEQEYAEACVQHANAEHEYAKECARQAQSQLEYAEACAQHAKAQMAYANACSQYSSKEIWGQPREVLAIQAFTKESMAQQAEARAKEAEYRRYNAYETRARGYQSRWERAQAARVYQEQQEQQDENCDYYEDDTTDYSHSNQYDRIEERNDKLEALKTWNEIQELLDEANRKRQREHEDAQAFAN